MRLTIAEYHHEGKMRRVEEAINSAEQKNVVGDTFCHICKTYIRNEMIWIFKWLTDYSSIDIVCLNCAPDLAALRKILSRI